MSNALVVAVTSAGIAFLTTILAAPLRMGVERNLHAHRLRAEYDYEQRRELRNLIGRYHGRLLEAAEQLHFRCLNIYAHDPEGWLENRGGFYFRTTCYRLTHLVALAHAFEREAFYIDGRIAEPTDLDFVRFVKAFLWALADTSLFERLPYNPSRSEDHFFFDQLRLLGETFYPRDRESMTIREFDATLNEHHNPFEEMEQFVLGLKRGEDRLRWDRLVVLHLLLIAFRNTVGYETHRSPKGEIATVESEIEHRQIRENLIAWLPKLGLADQPEMQRVAAIVNSSVAGTTTPSAGSARGS